MTENVTWLFIFLSAYWAYCGFFGIRGLKMNRTASDFFIASRDLGTWVYAMATTVASVAGLVIVAQPALVYRDGFQATNVSVIAIGIPLAGIVLLKRQWMISKHFSYTTPGELLADYFNSNAVRLISVGIAILFAVPFTAILLGATGFVISELTGGAINRTLSMWALSMIVLFYIVTGGLRAVANIGVVQCVLFAGVSLVIGGVAFNLLGGFEGFNTALGGITAVPLGQWGNTSGFGGGNYDGFFAVPGVIQFTAGLGKEIPIGGPWTSVMTLSYMFALMGVFSSPAFSMMGYASRSPRGFGVHQVWLTGLCLGIILIFFTNVQGLGAHLLGSDAAVNSVNLNSASAMPPIEQGGQAAVLVNYINYIGKTAPWAIGILGVCVVAAIHATAAIFLTTTSGILVRDIYRNYLDPEVNDQTQMLAGRICSALLLCAALLMATYSMNAATLLGSLALASSFQLWPSLLAVTWLPWLSRRAVTLGLIAGLIAVVLTEPIGQLLSGYSLPWGRWPLTIHSAGWGIFFNIAVCLIVVLGTKNGDTDSKRDAFHKFLRKHTKLPEGRDRLKPVAWLFALVWLFFGVGPGTVIGNDLFGAPDAGLDAWLFKMPSIWAWQIIWWALGVGMIWFLAYKMEMSTRPNIEIETLPQSETNV